MNLDRNLSRLYKLLKIALMGFILIKILSLNVDAKQQTSNVSGSIYTDYNGDCTGGQAGYCILQTNGVPYKRSLNTTYNGVLNAISFELHYVMNPNYQYTLNINGMSTDFRNNSLSVYVCGYNGSNNYNTCSQHPISVSFRFVSKSQLQIIFPVQTYETYKIDIVGSPLTGISTYGIKNMILVYDDNQADMSGVIENNNQNTTSIIDNNNSNTQDIIDKMTDLSYPSCADGNRYFLVGSDKSYIASQGTGQVNKNNNYYVSQPIKIRGGGSYTMNIVNATGIQYGYYCFYNNLNQRVSCTKFSDNTTTEYTFTAPTDAVYFRTTLYRSNNVMLNASIKGYTCVPDTYESNVSEFHNFISTNEINDYLKDDSNPTVDSQGIQDTMNSVSQTNPLEYFLTLPTTLINATLTGLNSNSCTAWKIGRFGTIGRHDLSNYEFTFPCINLRQKLGEDLFLVIDTFVAIGILTMTVVNLYHTISNYITLGAEDEVRSHSSFLSPMDFLGNILGGNAGGVISHMKE